MSHLRKHLRRFWCGLMGHGDTRTETIPLESGEIVLWECMECGTHRWKRTP